MTAGKIKLTRIVLKLFCKAYILLLCSPYMLIMYYVCTFNNTLLLLSNPSHSPQFEKSTSLVTVLATMASVTTHVAHVCAIPSTLESIATDL